MIYDRDQLDKMRVEAWTRVAYKYCGRPVSAFAEALAEIVAEDKKRKKGCSFEEE